MSADVVNLRQFRKAKSRVEKEKQAEQNRLTFGRGKAEKKLTEAENKKRIILSRQDRRPYIRNSYR